MISKEQFNILVTALKDHYEYTNKFNKAIAMLNSSHTVLELAPFLTEGILNALSKDFTFTASDIIFDYVYNNVKIVEWSEAEKDYSFKVGNPDSLYKILIKYFLIN